jgi:hypothetical protein
LEQLALKYRDDPLISLALTQTGSLIQEVLVCGGQLMGLPRFSYYEPSVQTRDDTAIVEAIAAICDEFEQYGWRRVRVALRQQGLVVNHKKIKRLMCEHDLSATTIPPLCRDHRQRP